MNIEQHTDMEPSRIKLHMHTLTWNPHMEILTWTPHMETLTYLNHIPTMLFPPCLRPDMHPHKHGDPHAVLSHGDPHMEALTCILTYLTQRPSDGDSYIVPPIDMIPPHMVHENM